MARRDYENALLEQMSREIGLDDADDFVGDIEIPNEHRVDLADNGATVQVVDQVIPGPFRDDYVEQQREMNRSIVGPRGELLRDDFDQKFMQQEREREEFGESDHFVQVNPRSAFKGTLGGHGKVVLAQPQTNPIGL